ncbi:NAD(P)-dependent dehydrogenase (short-subunit alcohol dehydrogenase family) [Marinobacterium sp. MBR-111]|jgi:NAD(P)-dependent dehydrogenase (short-subunit alcohol dehydrogenase family)
MNDSKPVVLVTGASKGIGLGIARVFADKGYRVAIAARHLDVQRVLRGTVPRATHVQAFA